MNNKISSLAPDYNQYQLVSLSLLRLLIGWHLLYEGMAKLSNANWTSAAYLLGRLINNTSKFSLNSLL